MRHADRGFEIINVAFDAVEPHELNEAEEPRELEQAGYFGKAKGFVDHRGDPLVGKR